MSGPIGYHQYPQSCTFTAHLARWQRLPPNIIAPCHRLITPYFFSVYKPLELARGRYILSSIFQPTSIVSPVEYEYIYRNIFRASRASSTSPPQLFSYLTTFYVQTFYVRSTPTLPTDLSSPVHVFFLAKNLHETVAVIISYHIIQRATTSICKVTTVATAVYSGCFFFAI